MQTKTKIKLLTSVICGILLMPLAAHAPVSAAALTSDLSQFTLYENPLAGQTETQFDLTLIPEPIDQVITTFSTNAECTLGHNLLDYSSGGAVVTKNDTLVFGLRSINDDDGEGDHSCDIRFSSVSAIDPEYANPVILEYSIQIVDDDIELKHEFSLSTLTLSRMQEGDNLVEQYQVDISHAPFYDVAITATADSQCDLLVGNPQTRSKTDTQTFTSGSSEPLRFTLIPREDADFEGIHQCATQHIVSTLDADFDGVTIPAYVATVLDNDDNPNIPDNREYEGGLIYYRDANFDGIDDDEQPYVSSFINGDRAARQGLMIVDQANQPARDCAFVGEITTATFDEQLASLTSSHGSLVFEIECSDEIDYRIVWLLDSYIEASIDWTMYDAATPGELNRIEHESIVFNLGDDFTSGIVIDVDETRAHRLLQTEPSENDGELALEEALIADVQNSTLNPLATLSAATALLTLLWILWRRYFGSVQTTKSRYPRIDRF